MPHDQPCKIKGRLCSTFFAFEAAQPSMLLVPPRYDPVRAPISIYKSGARPIAAAVAASSAVATTSVAGVPVSPFIVAEPI